MKPFLVCLLSFLLGVNSLAVAQKPGAAVTPQVQAAKPLTGPPTPNTLLDGTPVKLRLTETLTSATAKAGQQVSFEVTEDVMVQGVLVLGKGSQALATVTEANTKKSMGRGGKLNVNVDSARLADGEKVQLRAAQDNKGGGHIAVMTGAMVATSIVFFPAAPLFLFIHGKDITISKGTEITAFVEGDTKLDMAKFVPAPSIASKPGLLVEASVPNCDIEVDGSFYGQHSVNTQPIGRKARHRGQEERVSGLDAEHDGGSGAVRLNAEMVLK